MSEPEARILLVDDHQDTLMLQAMLLRKRGYEVETAESAEAALAVAAEKPVDLVVSDLRLPDRSGMELMRELHEREGLRGVALTGVPEDEVAAAGRQVGFVRTLIKPIVPEQLDEAIKAALSGADPA